MLYLLRRRVISVHPNMNVKTDKCSTQSGQGIAIPIRIDDETRVTNLIQVSGF